MIQAKDARTKREQYPLFVTPALSTDPVQQTSKAGATLEGTRAKQN